MPTVDIPATFAAGGIYTAAVPDVHCTETNDGDTSYLQQLLPLVSSGFTGYSDFVAFPATSIPVEPTSVSLVTVTKGTDSRTGGGAGYPYGALFAITVDGNFRYWLDVFADGASDWTEIVTPLDIDEDGHPVTITKAMLEAGTVRYNSTGAMLNDSIQGPGAGYDSRWTYIALRVEYEGVGIIPPRRIFQRKDGATHGGRSLFSDGPIPRRLGQRPL